MKGICKDYSRYYFAEILDHTHIQMKSLKIDKINLYVKLKSNEKIKHIITNWKYYTNTALLKRKVFKVLMKKVWKELIGGYLQAYFLIML